MGKQQLKPIKLSASGLDMYEACPLRYRLRFVEWLPEKGFSAPGAFGTAFHKVAQLMYELKNFDRKWMLSQWPDVFHQVFSDPNVEKLDKEALDRFRGQGYPILNIFFNKENKDEMLKPAIALEKRFEIPYKLLPDGREVLLTGSIDRLIDAEYKGDDSVEITDYKTTVSQPMSEDELLKTIQLPLYSLVYRWLHENDPKQFPNPKHHINMFYVRHSEKVQAKVLKEHRVALRKRINRNLEGILDKEFKPKKDENNWSACKGCTFQNICPAYGNKLPDFEKIRKEREAKAAKLKRADIKLGRLRVWKNEDGKHMEIKPKQIEDVAHMSEHKFTLNANGVGAGKTVESIALVEHLVEEEGAQRVLLLLPKPLRGQWKEKIKEWTGVLKGDVRIIRELPAEERKKHYGKRLWTIANYDKVLTDQDAIRAIDWDLLICDECQRLSGTSKSASVIRSIRAKRRVALTATPISSRLDKLFRVMAFVKPGLLGPWTEFQKHHFVYDGSGKLIGFKNLMEIRDKLGNHFIRRTKKEIFPDSKDPSIEPVLIDMSVRQRALYKENLGQLERLLEKAQLNEEKTVGFLDSASQAKWMKIRRMLSFTHLIDGGTFDSPKYDYAKEIIEDVLDADEKIIIFSQYLTVIKELRKKLERDGFKNVLEISGGEKRDRDEVRHLINKSDKHRILLMTDSGKFGLNIHGVNNMINMELPEDPETITQRVGRIARPEQMRDMNVWNFVMKKTFEVKIHKRRHLRAQLSKIIVDRELDKDTVDLREASTLSVRGMKELLI